MVFSAVRAGRLALASSASVLALSAPVAKAEPADYIAELSSTGTYLSGDKHNHTTCTDGAMSVQTVVNESLITYGLDWFAQTGHGGEGNRDCRFDDPEYDGANSYSGRYWEQTIGADAIEGDEEFSGSYGANAFFGRGAREMWRWQSVSEYAYQQQRAMGDLAGETAWIGVEHNAPGHEHVDMAIIDNQFGPRRARRGANPIFEGDAYATAQFEYLWDASDDDLSGGGDNDFENPRNNGVPKTTDDRRGIEGRFKAIASVEWMVENFGAEGYYVPAHVERQGAFDPNGRRGWNVEDFRYLYDAGLLSSRDVRRAERQVERRRRALPGEQSIVFGAEMLAGHQFANGGRGTYELDRPTAGFGTYGGAGAYSGAEVSVPGFAFDGGDPVISTGSTAPSAITVPTDGEPLEVSDLEQIRAEFDAVFNERLTEPSGSDQFDSFVTSRDLVRYTLGRPGLNTMWDALLSEGRRFFNFGSSDWHNRGTFGPFEPQSTLDPWPGEYNKLYAYGYGDEFGMDGRSARAIIEGMRTGNTWSVFGDLIDEFYFVMCQDGFCVTMGQNLLLDPNGGPVEWRVELRDPEGANFSPYTFPNMSLQQIGITVPTNEPELSHIDIITGDLGPRFTEEDPEFFTAVSNPSTRLFDRVDADDMSPSGDRLVASGTIPLDSIAEGGQYFRVRGTNMPVGTPNETDADGNPLLDDFASLIPCTAVGSDSPAEVAAVPANSAGVASLIFAAAFDGSVCPDHLPVDSTGQKFLDADVEAWTDLWFYANPIWVSFDTEGRRTTDRERERNL